MANPILQFHRAPSSPESILALTGIFGDAGLCRPALAALVQYGGDVAANVRWLAEEGDNLESLHQFAAEEHRLLGDRPVILIGSSIGGIVAIDYARRHPDTVAAVVLSGCPGAGMTARLPLPLPQGRGKEEIARFVRALRSQLFVDPTVVPDTYLDAAVERIITRPRTIRAVLRLLSAADRYPATEHLPLLSCPILGIWGDSDRVTPVERWRPIFANLPNATLHTVPGVGHAPLIEAPAAFSSYVLEFLERREVAA